MRRASVVAASVLAGVVAVAALATAGASAQGPVWHQMDNAWYVSAQFDNFGPITTRVSIFALKNPDWQTGDVPNGPKAETSYVQILQWDNQNNGYGVRAGLSDGSLDVRINEHLSRATVNGTLSGVDWVTGSPISVSIDLVATGGDLATFKSDDHVAFPGIRINHFNHTVYRPAEVTGTISDGSQNFTPAPSVQGYISHSVRADVWITE